MMGTICVLLLGLLAVVPSVHGAKEYIQSQNPEVVPKGRKYESEVPGGVLVLANERRETTKLFYTLSKCCCKCSCVVSPDAKKAGIDKPTQEIKELLYRIPISNPGKNCVSAIALTEGNAVSDVVQAEYDITLPPGAHLRPPVIQPVRGKYRGFVKVVMNKADGSEFKKGEYIHYSIDNKPAHLTPETGRKYEAPFEITDVGVHTIKAVFVSEGVESAAATRVLEVVLPLAYQVVPAAPKQGQRITLMFQGFKLSPVTRVFVSTTDCSNKNLYLTHQLRGCDCPFGVVPRTMTHSFVSREYVDKVYVCYSKDDGKTWVRMMRGDTRKATFPIVAFAQEGSAAGDDEDGHGLGEEVEDQPPVDWAEYYKGLETPTASRGNWVEPFVVIIVILVCLTDDCHRCWRQHTHTHTHTHTGHWCALHLQAKRLVICPIPPSVAFFLFPPLFPWRSSCHNGIHSAL